MINKTLLHIFLWSCILGLVACSSCNSTEPPSDGSITMGDNGNSHTESLYRTEEERLQAAINARIEEQVSVARSISSKRVQEMIAGFKMGMSRRQVRKHFLRMKQKKHLVRVKKGQRRGSSKTYYEYVYRLPLASGKSNTTFEFEHVHDGGVYKLICEPRPLRKLKQDAFVEEIRDLLQEWYGKPNFALPQQEGCGRYIWIAGNRHLDLHATPKGVEFIYTDLNVEIPPNIDGGGEERPAVDLVM